MMFMGINIEKGETLPVNSVLQAIGKPHLKDPAQLAFALLSFAKRLEVALRKEGYQANCKATDNGVSWLTDSESLAFNFRRRRCGKRKLRNAMKGLDNVTESELTEHEKRVFDKQSRLLQQELAAMRGVSAIEFAVPARSKR